MSEVQDLKSAEKLFSENKDLQKISYKNQQMLRSSFYQIPSLWLQKASFEVLPEEWIHSGKVFHPRRPQPKPGQVMYQRFIPELGRTLRFRVVDPETQDVVTFHEWQNQPRVADFWELNKPLDELKTYLQKGILDPHQIPMFVEFDGIPVGYFEMYWTLEDRLGPYYEADAFDRGFHFLIGNTDFLGLKNTDAVLKSVCHFLFLDDPRTRRLMAEPRSDNQKVLKYVGSLGWKKIKEFDFPHKRAALLQCKREDFFMENHL